MNTLIRIAAVAVVAALGLPAVASAAGNGAPSGAHYNLNIIGVPKGKTASLTGTSGKSLFVPLSGTCKIALVVGAFDVQDRNCTDGSAKFSLPNPVDADGKQTYQIYARALGKPGGSSVTTTCATDPVTGEELCSLTSLTLTRKAGQTQFSNVTKTLTSMTVDLGSDGILDTVNLFDTRLTDYFWSYQNNQLRLAQLRFYM